MENNLEKTFNNVLECKNRQVFTKQDLQICYKRIDLLKKEVPKDYVFYDELMTAVDATTLRLNVKNYLLDHPLNSTKEVIDSNFKQMTLSKKEQIDWSNYFKLIEASKNPQLQQSPKIDLWDVGSAILLVLSFFMAYLYFKGVFKKMAYSLKLKQLNLHDYAVYVDQDIMKTMKIKYEAPKFSLFPKKKDKEADSDKKTEEKETEDIKNRRIKYLYAIYSNIWAIDVAYIELITAPERNDFEKEQKKGKINKLIKEFEEKVKLQIEKGI